MADQVTTSLAEAKVLVMQGQKGDSGYSPQIEVLDITGGHKVQITYQTERGQIQTQNFDVMDGTDGEPGAPGEPGFSPTVSVQDITESLPGGGTKVIGHTVTITDATGAHTFNVMNGEDGEGGGGGAAEAVLYIAQSLTAAQKAQARTNIGAGTYSKPSGGIPKTDLASDVQTSLGKADTALQPNELSTAVSNLDVYVYALSVSGTSVSLATSFTDFYNKYAKGLRPLIYLPYGGGVSDPIAMEMRLIYVDALAISITLRGEHDGNRYEVTLSASSYTATPMTGTLVTTPLQELPAVSAADNGKSLVVENGAWGKGYQAARTPRIAMTASDTTPTLDPNKLYVFPEMATLTPTLATPTDNAIVNEYHFVFDSGSTATVLTLPASVLQPDGFTVEANMHYEISILEGAMTAQGWAVTA